jgi:hypothetical protein
MMVTASILFLPLALIGMMIIASIFISSVNTPIRMMIIASILFLLIKSVGMMVTLVNRFYFFR